jgi:heterodisulfide reductase subunit A
MKLTIDGKEIQVEEGTSILEAAQQLGIKIPTLCYHKALPAYGACRLCLVEISQNGRPPSVQASCTYPAQEGLAVKTDTERVTRARTIMAELLLARCPDSEEVQRIAKELGVGKPRIEPKNEDCMLCGLCVRMCQERMGRGAISFAGRGSERKVQPAFDEQSDVCRTCGACYSVCPTTKGIKLEEITKNKPRPILSEFDRGLRERSAIYIAFPQAVPNYATIDERYCAHLLTGECQVCTEFCEADAIDFDQKEQKLKLNVGSVVLSPGYELFDPAVKNALGYKKCANVLTSAEFERILSPSGPYQGHIQRPSDGVTPRRIAFIQCVGSRDSSPEVNAPYCSSVCCMHAIKEAVIAREHEKDTQATIFFMDIRAHGKDFDKYYERAKDEYGVKFIRSKVDKIDEIESSGNALVYFTTDEGRQETSEFEMVVLAVGFRPPEDMLALSDKLDVRLNKYDYLASSPFTPIETSRPGILACGAALSPKDIPETVMQASGAVAGAAELLSDVRGTEVIEKQYPPERDVSGQSPRIGVFVCHCGINIGSVVDVPGVVEYAKTLPDVVYSECNLFTCSQDTQQKIKQVIEEQNLNRVIVASCSPRTHEPLFQETLKESGLNPRLFEMANIRDQCSWVHMNEPEKATRKAKDLVRMAVGKSRSLEPLYSVSLDVIQKGLVIGGGLAGMVSGLSLAEQGFEITIVEREKELGGNLNHVYFTPQGDDVQGYLKQLIKKVESHPEIKVYKEATIESIDGYVGNYKTSIKTKDRSARRIAPLEGNGGSLRSQEASSASSNSLGQSSEGNDTTNPASGGVILRAEGDTTKTKSDTTVEIEHGIVIVATGAEEYEPTEYLYGKDERVATQVELEKKLAETEKILAVKGKKPRTDIQKLKSVVMIQCVGSRDEKHPYCSRVCCQKAIKNALKLRKLNPRVNIYVLYRDVRTYGFAEEYYETAREKGIIFIRYEEDQQPVVERAVNQKPNAQSQEPQEEGLIVKVRDPILGRDLVIEPDLLVLATAIIPRPDAIKVSQMLKAPLNEDSFFLEAHAKLRPVDFATEGVFLAGLAHSPKTMDETISQAKAAAGRAGIILSKDKYEAEAAISHVNVDVCAGCGVCVATCPYDAPALVMKEGRIVSQVNEALCKGCGSCACACPSGAIDHLGFRADQTLTMIEAALR